MALTIHNNCRAGALDGLTALLAGGDFRLLTAANAELATLRFQTSGGAFGAATAASPAVATSTTIGSDTTPTPGTIAKFELRSAGATVLISGSAAAGSPSGDLNLSDVVIPSNATEVTCTGGIQLSLSLT
jgi:hypothetical protein